MPGKRKGQEFPSFGRYSNGLFGPGTDIDLNACVGFNGGPSDYQRHGWGFFEAGNRLLSSLLDNSVGIDGLIYPLVTLYRQGIELYLKHYCSEIPPLLQKESKVKYRHELDLLWTEARQLLTELIDEPDEQAFKADADWVDTIIRDFVAVDRGGAVFRYPTDKKDVPHLLDLSLINAGVFGEQMLKLYEVLETMCSLVSSALDYRADYLSSMAEMKADYEAELDYHGDNGY